MALGGKTGRRQIAGHRAGQFHCPCQIHADHLADCRQLRDIQLPRARQCHLAPIDMPLGGQPPGVAQQVRVKVCSQCGIDRNGHAKAIRRGIARKLARQRPFQRAAHNAINAARNRQGIAPPIRPQQLGQRDLCAETACNRGFGIDHPLPLAHNAHSPMRQSRRKVIDDKPLIPIAGMGSRVSHLAIRQLHFVQRNAHAPHRIACKIDAPVRSPDMFRHAGELPRLHIAEPDCPVPAPIRPSRSPIAFYLAARPGHSDLCSEQAICQSAGKIHGIKPRIAHAHAL